MATLIVRSLDDSLAARLKCEAQKRGVSVNKVIHQLLAQALSGRDGDRPRNDLRRLAGQWSARDAREFTAATRGFSEIDSEMWK